MKAVKQGATPAPTPSSSSPITARKVFCVSDHAGVALAGITADGRVLSRFIRSESIIASTTPSRTSKSWHFWVCTHSSWKRPCGVGLLVAGLDESGAHLYYNCPSGNYFEYQAFDIGSRSQAAKTFL
ncbi:hypothetical protein ABZP36_033157 [Zizania latifolia]